MTNKRTATEKVTVDPFNLLLPDMLASIKPAFTVELPGGHVGLIYEETLTERSCARAGSHYTPATSAHETSRKGWRYMVRKADGNPVSERLGVGHWAGAFYDNHLDLKLAIEYDAVKLVPKTRTRREREEYDD